MTRFERLLHDHGATTGDVTGWLAESSAHARAEARDVRAAVAEVSSGALAPLLLGYALWVINEAGRQGIRRLYYVARDGRVMLDAARHVRDRLAPDIELRYLYGSRQPWAFGASATSDRILDAWVRVTSEATPRTAFRRVGLTPGDVYRLTGSPIAKPSHVDNTLTASERAQVARMLKQPPLVGRVRAAARREAELATAYFEQEGFLDGVPSALVDTGWEGRAAAAFDHLLSRVGALQVTHFVVGILHSTSDPRSEDGVRMVPWLFDEFRDGSPWPGVPRPHLLVEMFTASTAGRTVGYRRNGERIEPVLSAPKNEPLVAWGLSRMQEVAVHTVELTAPHLNADALHANLRPAVVAVLNAFWSEPTEQEAKAWGSFPWEEEWGPPYVAVAERITLRSVVARAVRGEFQLRSKTSWRAGTEMRSGQPWRAIMRLRTWQLKAWAGLRAWLSRQ